MFFFLSDQSEHGEKAYPRVPYLDRTADEVVRDIILFCFVFGSKILDIKSQAFADKDHLVSEPGGQEGKLTESGSS